MSPAPWADIIESEATKRWPGRKGETPRALQSLREGFIRSKDTWEGTTFHFGPKGVNSHLGAVVANGETAVLLTGYPTGNKSRSLRYWLRTATTGDLPRLRRWRRSLKVRPWWGEPHEQFELLRADLNEPLMKMRVVSFDERPVAYAHYYEVQACPQAHLTHLQQGSRGRSTASSAGPR